METKDKIKRNNIIMASVALALLLGLGYVSYNLHLENKELKQVVSLEKEEKLSLLSSLQEIESNLMSINKHETAVVKNLNASHKDKDGVDRIQDEIEVIETLVKKNEELIKSLEKKAEAKDEQLDDYAQRIDAITYEMNQSKAKLNQLKSEKSKLMNQLAEAEQREDSLQFKVAEQNKALMTKVEQLEAQQQIINDQEADLNTVYYVVGDFKDLKQHNVATREGGLLGLATKDLKEDFNKDHFVRIDRRRSRYIPVFSKAAQLITDHHPESYEWVEEDGTVTYLHITEPMLFWESGKYLVIETKSNWEEVFAAL